LLDALPGASKPGGAFFFTGIPAIENPDLIVQEPVRECDIAISRAGTETRPYLPKITDNRQMFTELVEATWQLSVVAPKLVKISIIII